MARLHFTLFGKMKFFVRTDRNVYLNYMKLFLLQTFHRKLGRIWPQCKSYEHIMDEQLEIYVKSLSGLCAQSVTCVTLWDPRDCRLPVSSVHSILQERILEWVAMPSSRGSSRHRDQTHVLLHFLHWQADSSSLALPGKPLTFIEP